MSTTDQTASVHSEAASHLFARLQSAQLRTGLEPLDRLIKFSPGQIQFIQGPKASGKTELIYRLLSKSILPKEWRGIELGGHECRVVLIDTDLKFNLQRVLVLLQATLVQALTAHEARSSAEEIERELEMLFKSSLQRLHVIQCVDALTFRATLHALPEHVTDARLLLIDSLDVFYWANKHVTRDSRLRDEELVRAVVSKCQMLTAVLTVSSEYRAPTSHVLKGVKQEPVTDHVLHLARRDDPDWPIEISYLQHVFGARVTARAGLEVQQ